MNKMVFIVFCLLASLSSAVTSARSLPDQDATWWKPILHLINDPCTPIDTQLASPPFPSDSPPFFSQRGAREKGAKKDCLPLDKSSFLPAVKEARDLAGHLLKDRRARRWTRGHFSTIARKHRCELKLCVPAIRRPELTRVQVKVTEDLIQLASFAYYLNTSLSTLKGRNKGLGAKSAELSSKLKVISCILRSAVTKNTLEDDVTQNDVPVDLRHKKRSLIGRVATYVIWEKLETYLRDLPGTYRRNGFKLCK